MRSSLRSVGADDLVTDASRAAASAADVAAEGIERASEGLAAAAEGVEVKAALMATHPSMPPGSMWTRITGRGRFVCRAASRLKPSETWPASSPPATRQVTESRTG